jgi:hypothetical protein
VAYHFDIGWEVREGPQILLDAGWRAKVCFNAPERGKGRIIVSVPPHLAPFSPVGPVVACTNWNAVWRLVGALEARECEGLC